MDVSIVTIDIGNLYKDSGQNFCLSPRSKSTTYDVYTVVKPIRLLRIQDQNDNDLDLDYAINYLNDNMYYLDGCLLGSEKMTVWLLSPSSTVYKHRSTITRCRWDTDIEPYITSVSTLDNKYRYLIEKI